MHQDYELYMLYKIVLPNVFYNSLKDIYQLYQWQFSPTIKTTFIQQQQQQENNVV